MPLPLSPMPDSLWVLLLVGSILALGVWLEYR